MMPSHISAKERESLAFKQNKDAWVRRIADFHTSLEKVRQGGGPKAVERQHARGRLTARERMARLIIRGVSSRRSRGSQLLNVL